MSAFKLNFFEYIIVSLCILTGAAYIGLIVMDLSNSNTHVISASRDQLMIDKTAFLNQTRDIFIAVVAILGAIKIFQKKSFGWSAAFVIILLLLSLSCAMTIEHIQNNHIGSSMIAFAVASAIMICLMIYLLVPSTRQKWRLTTGNYIITVVMIGMISLLLFS